MSRNSPLVALIIQLTQFLSFRGSSKLAYRSNPIFLASSSGGTAESKVQSGAYVADLHHPNSLSYTTTDAGMNSRDASDYTE